MQNPNLMPAAISFPVLGMPAFGKDVPETLK